jgi:hypothetical protein
MYDIAHLNDMLIPAKLCRINAYLFYPKKTIKNCL